MSADAVVQPLLPPPPWRLHTDFVRGQRKRSVAFFALALFAGYWVQEGLPGALAILRDQAVHADADVTVAARWRGLQYRPHGAVGPAAWLIPWITDGTVSYTQQDGRRAYRQLQLATLHPFPTPKELTVEYVRAEPERWVSSWAVLQTGNRVGASVPRLVLASVVAAWALWCSLAAARLLALARIVAANGVVRLGTLRGYSQSTLKGRLVSRSFRVAVDLPGGARFTARATIPAGSGSPLTLPGERTVVLVPSDGARRALVLRQDLWPLHLRDDDVARIAEILQQIDPDAGWRTSMTTKGLRVTCRSRFVRELAQSR